MEMTRRQRFLQFLNRRATQRGGWIYDDRLARRAFVSTHDKKARIEQDMRAQQHAKCWKE